MFIHVSFLLVSFLLVPSSFFLVPFSPRPVILVENGHLTRYLISTVGPLAKDHTREEVDLSFADCHCLAVVKANRTWQWELLNPKPVCVVEAIPLAAAIFWNSNFTLCIKYTLSLAKKLWLQTKNLRADIVKERIGHIWAHRTRAEFDLLFKNNPDWWCSIVVIFAQATAQPGKNVK